MVYGHKNNHQTSGTAVFQSSPVAKEEVILSDEYTDDELHKIAESLKNKIELKIKHPAAYKQASRRGLLRELFYRPRKDSIAVYLWEALGEPIGDPFDELRLIKVGKSQPNPELRIQDVAQEHGFVPKLRGLVISSIPAKELENTLLEIGQETKIRGKGEREFRAVTKKELNYALDVLTAYAEFVLVMKKV